MCVPFLISEDIRKIPVIFLDFFYMESARALLFNPMTGTFLFPLVFYPLTTLRHTNSSEFHTLTPTTPTIIQPMLEFTKKDKIPCAVCGSFQSCYYPRIYLDETPHADQGN